MEEAKPDAGMKEDPLERVENDADAPMRAWARRTGCPCSNVTVYLYTVVLIWTAWTLYYTLLFGIWQSRETTEKMLIDFAFSQFISLCVFHPGIALLTVSWTFVIKPSWLPYLAWVPCLGRLLLGSHAAVAGGSAESKLSSATLTGRLQNLTMVRAAGAAIMLPPDAAIIAYGVSGAVSGILNGMSNRRKKDSPSQVENTRFELSAALHQYKQDLAVRSYSMEQVLLAYARKAANDSQSAQEGGLGNARTVDSADVVALASASGTVATLQEGAVMSALVVHSQAAQPQPRRIHPLIPALAFHSDVKSGAESSPGVATTDSTGSAVRDVPPSRDGGDQQRQEESTVAFATEDGSGLKTSAGKVKKAVRMALEPVEALADGSAVSTHVPSGEL